MPLPRLLRVNREVVVAPHRTATVDPALRATRDELNTPDPHRITDHLDHVRRAGGTPSR